MGAAQKKIVAMQLHELRGAARVYPRYRPAYWLTVLAVMLTAALGEPNDGQEWVVSGSRVEEVHPGEAAGASTTVPDITWFKSRNDTQLRRNVNGSIEWGAISKPGKVSGRIYPSH